MTTLAEYMIVAGAENRPHMLDKTMYNLWQSRTLVYIKGKKNGRMMLEAIENGSLVYPTIEENGQIQHSIVTGVENHSPMLEKLMYNSWASSIRLFIKGKKHAQQLQDDCDVQATNIILHGLSPDLYALVNHKEVTKDIWDRVKMLMKGTELSYQEHECKLFNLFDKFAHVQGETLYEYYWRFSQLINGMHTIGMTIQQVQVNTKLLNALPSE
uniref:Integrase, catalytic region, zinc finger, CCHC-type, peptidase aspartic, catalytic n=1 Tax=Tanacetum cinerariifolium TaxID=118510 RepID=A0A699K0P8_TANCI|nr:hypothetical protein [Tanacetum cinerariifolium]